MRREGKGKARKKEEAGSKEEGRREKRRENRKRSGHKKKKKKKWKKKNFILFLNLVKPKMHVKCSRVIPKRIEIEYLTSKLAERGKNGMKERGNINSM